MAPLLWVRQEARGEEKWAWADRPVEIGFCLAGVGFESVYRSVGSQSCLRFR